MSGFEIAGIVLGAIPIFVSVAKQYREGLGTINKFFKQDRILKLYIQELETYQTFLRLHLERVVSNTNLPAKTQKDLVENPISPQWQEQHVQRQLRRSLGETADIFTKTVTRIADIFVQQIETDSILPGHDQYKLDSGQSLRRIVVQSLDAKPPWLKVFSKQVVFSWRSPKRNEILISLNTCNEHLYRLINAVEEARPYRKKQQVRKVHAAWQSRMESQRLFDILTSSCTCSCKSPHRAKMRIKPRTDDYDSVDVVYMHFDVSFQRRPDHERVMTVKMYRESITNTKNTGVRIAISGSSSTQDRSRWKTVSNICSAVKTASDKNQHLALAVDDSKELWETEISPTRSLPPTKPSLSLQALFPRFSQFANRKWLIREKLILAVISAYSTLQLHDSPWLPLGFSSSQIFFSERGTHFGAATTVEAGNALGQPYVSIDVSAKPQSRPATTRVHRNRYLLCLGVMLLELHLNRLLQSSSTDLTALQSNAIELLQDQYDDCSMSLCYYEAIRFCLVPKPDPSTRVTDLADHAFREMYYRNVILPLEEELHENFEIGQKFWDDL